MYDEMSGEVEENLKPFTSMGRLGFEPKTNRLKAECSTAELATRCVDKFTLFTRFTNLT